MLTGRRAQAQSDAQAQAQVQASAQGGEEVPHKEKDTSHEMVVACCRFLCYFCRTSRQNQKAMFDHLAFLLENSNILLSRYIFTLGSLQKINAYKCGFHLFSDHR